MPCYTEQTITTVLRCEKKDLLKYACMELGWEYVDQGANMVITDDLGNTIRVDGKKAEFNQRAQDSVNRLKRQYSMENIKASCQDVGATVEFSQQTA